MVDRLSIVAHDRFQEIIDEANRPDSIIRLTQVVLDPSTDLQKTKTVPIQSNLVAQIDTMADESERRIAQATCAVIRRYEHLPASADLLKSEIREQIVQEVTEYVRSSQQALPGVTEQPDIAVVVEKTTELVVRQTIDIPRILVVPKGELTTGFHPFTLDCSSIRYQPVERDLLIQLLRTHEQDTLGAGEGRHPEQRLEDYLVRGLIDFDDIAYDEHADLLYDLAGQVVRHLRSYLSEEDTRNVLTYHQKQLEAFIHAQMQAHQWEQATGYEVRVSKGFIELKSSACTANADEPPHDFRQTVDDKSRISRIVFRGFARCLYALQKFQSDAERRLAVILDREAHKWFKPVQGQFPITFKMDVEYHDYVPDFVAETTGKIYMLEAKARNEMTDADVLAKKDAAILWCTHATTHAISNGGKPWIYLLIPHDAIAENMTLGGLVNRFATAPDLDTG